jgi:integrase
MFPVFLALFPVCSHSHPADSLSSQCSGFHGLTSMDAMPSSLPDIQQPGTLGARQEMHVAVWAICTTLLPWLTISRKWKGSTAECNEYRLRFHLTNEFGARTIGGFSRDELQTLLDRKTADGLSYSTVAHLRWDLSQVFKMVVAEGYVLRSPAALLFVPREAPRPSQRTLTIEEVRTVLSVLELREGVIAGLAIIAGMRPGEIFGLRRGQLEREYVNVQQRVYRGVVGTPKTFNSRRWAARSEGVLKWIEAWLEFVPDQRPDA